MAEYLAPGVYVEEVERGAAPLEGVSTSTAGFLGPTERGPTGPRLVTSVSDFRRWYGGYLDDSFLPAAVDGYFRNGGSRCFLGRISATDEVAEATLSDDGSNGTDVLTIEATGPGSWAERVVVIVSNASMHGSDEDLFRITVRYWADDGDAADAAAAMDSTDTTDVELPAPDVEEVYDDLSTNKRAGNYVENTVNGTSTLVEVGVESEDDCPANHVDADGAPEDPVWLEGSFSGSDSVDATDYAGDDRKPPEDRSGFEGFKLVPEISIVCVPDAEGDDALTEAVIDHCEGMDDRFGILQAGRTDSDVGSLSPPDDTDMAAFYYPWVKARHPETGLVEEVPPGGHVAGIYARSDARHGVHKAPANEVVRGAVDVQRPVTKGDQEVLNPRGVNCIRSFRGRGIRVWGARTSSSNPQWRYVNVRRLFLFLRGSIERGTQWVVFEPNNEELWARVRQTIKNFLTDVWEDGALMGTTPEEAFFVNCDRTTMTQSDIENGRLICEIGVAPTRPAEFVIFRISQWTGDAN